MGPVCEVEPIISWITGGAVVGTLFELPALPHLFEVLEGRWKLARMASFSVLG